MSEDLNATGPANLTKLGEDMFDLVSGGAFPGLDPDG